MGTLGGKGLKIMFIVFFKDYVHPQQTLFTD